MSWIIYYKNDPYELPVFVGDTLRECSDWLHIPLQTLKTGFKRHGKYTGRIFNVERVQKRK